MTFLSRRALVLAQIEGVFRTDQVPEPTAQTNTAIDSTTDVDDTTETITANTPATHTWQTGDGPVQLTTSTLLPTPLLVLTDYWVIRVDANDFRLAASLADAKAGTPIDITVAVGTFAVTDVQSSSFLVEEPDFAPEITVVERNNARVTLSFEPGVVTRKIATVTFAHEVRGNGVTDATTRSRLGVLLQGCGMSETKFGETGNEVETILEDVAVPVNDPTGTFTYVKATAYGGTLPRVVILECTTGGGSGAALFNVFSPSVGAQAEVFLTAQSMTDATDFQLVNDTPAADAEITPTVTGNFDIGDTFVINLAPAGHFYEPVSEGFESLTMYLYFGETTGAILHKMTGSRGTFEVTGEAADYARFNFTFTGDYVAPADSALPSNPENETTLPVQVDLANLVVLGGKDFDATDPDGVNQCAASFSIDLANNVVARTCINDAESLAGGLITGRSPVGSFNPETELEATHPYWANLAAGTRVFWNVRVGTVQGNVVVFTAPHAQYIEIGYGNRDDIRIYEVSTALRTLGADDELRIVIC